MFSQRKSIHVIHACSEEAVPESSPHGFGLVFVKGLVLIPGEAVDESSKGLATHEDEAL